MQGIISSPAAVTTPRWIADCHRSEWISCDVLVRDVPNKIRDNLRALIVNYGYFGPITKTHHAA